MKFELKSGFILTPDSFCNYLVILDLSRITIFKTVILDKYFYCGPMPYGRAFHFAVLV